MIQIIVYLYLLFLVLLGLDRHVRFMYWLGRFIGAKLTGKSTTNEENHNDRAAKRTN